MSVVAITSSRTSPGATTLAVGLSIAWSQMAERSLLIEADPAGGVLALRFDLGTAPSLASLGSAIHHEIHSAHVWANTQDLRGARCIPAPVDPVQSRAWVTRVAPALVEQLPQLGAPAVVDLGWVDHEGASACLASAADRTLIVTRPDIAEIQALLFQVRRLQGLDTEVALVTVGDSPHRPRDVAELAGIPLVAVLPEDRRVASALAGGEFKPEKFRRSSLWRTISGLAATLLDRDLMHTRAADVASAAPYVAAPPSFEEMRGTLDELSPEALRSMAPLPAPPPQLREPRQPQSHLMVAALEVPAPIPPPPSASSIARVLATQPPPPASPVTSNRPTIIALPALSTTAAVVPPSRSPSYPPTPPDDPSLLDATVRLRQPTIGPQASLVLPTGSRRSLFAGQTFTIGRHSDCDIKLNDSEVSRRHGRLVPTADGWHYADLGSRNGTQVNNYPCTDTLLSPGDTLTIGRSVMTFETTGSRGSIESVASAMRPAESVSVSA